MKKGTLLLHSALAGALASGLFLAGDAVFAAEEKEKCYGISKAGENDCATQTGSCAGTSKVDLDPSRYKLVNKGKCVELGGKLTPPS